MNWPLRVLQISDVHFGARLTAGKLGLTQTQARERERERREGFSKALKLVHERNLDGVLLPGDLFDDEAVSTDTLRFVMERLGSIAPKPVFIAPGNHDPYGGTSAYHPGDRGRSRGLKWPGNVYMFAHEEFKSVGWPHREDISVTGCGVAVNHPSQERRLAAPIERLQAAVTIFLFHGSRDDRGQLQAHKATYPFSEEELRDQGFTWTALGHYHDYQIARAADGTAIGAYAGCSLASGLSETGAKGCLIVELEPGRARVERVILDPRQVRDIRCDLTGSPHADDARARIRESVGSGGAGSADMVYLRLTGRMMPGLDLSFLEELASGYFQFKSDLSGLIPDVDLASYPALEAAATTEERFVARLRQSLDKSGPDAAAARRALLYGLDALHQQRIDARYEE